MKLSRKHVLCLLMLLFGIMLMAIPCFAKEHNATDAWVMAQDFVSSELVNPKSAKFPWSIKNEPGCKLVDFEDGQYYVRAWVDSKNAYGAKVRTWFSILVKYVGNNNWTASDLHWLKK